MKILQRLGCLILDLLARITGFFIKTRKGKHYLPAIKNPLLLKSATELANDIKTRKVSSEEVVQAFIDRINETDRYVNAVCHKRFNEAIIEAREIDSKLNATPEDPSLLSKPFLGVPFTGKDSIAVKGLYWTAGLVSRKGICAPFDATVTARMKEAGAICLGITNCPELVFWWDSDNMLHGRTNNPYDLSRIPGGSTGGGAAVVSVAGSVLQTGGDIGGSIRMPCFFNGIWGHKPSPFIVDCKGHFPEIPVERQKFLGLGPMTRYAVDLLPMFRVMAGEESLQKNLPDLNEPVDLSQLKVYYMLDAKDPKSIPVRNDIKEAIMSLVNHLKDTYRCQTKEVFFEDFKDGRDIFLQNFRVMRPDHPSFEEMMTDGKGSVNLWCEFGKKLINKSDFTLVTLLLALNDKLVVKKASEATRQYWVKRLDKLKDDFYKTIGEDGIFLYPIHPEPAPKHKTTILKQQHPLTYSSIINCLEVPVTQCPLGLTKAEGLPIGVQVIAGPKKDRLTLAVAKEVESRFGGWIPPTLVNLPK